jgi:hypothetical protein
MRSDNDAFNSANQSDTKKPRYVIEIAFDAGSAPTDLYYFTSHSDCDTPSGATVFYRVVNNISGTSQKLDVLNARATIGAISFKLQDNQHSITDLINTKLTAGDGLREKRVRIYIGAPELAWSEYQLVQTQLIQTISIGDDGIYTFRCSDLQRVTRKSIFDPEKANLDATLTAPATTALTANVGAGDTTFNVLDTSAFTSTGKLYIDQEICSYTGTPTATTITGITRGVNGTTAVSHLGASGGDAVITQVRNITIPSTQTNAKFELLEHGTSYADAPSQTVGYFKIDDEIFRYYSKASITEFTDCVSGVLDTKAVEHEVDVGITEEDRKPKLQEYIYLEMPILKLALAILTGDLDGQPGKTLPIKWHLGIDTGFVATSKFKVHPDLYDPSDDTLGFPTRFEGLEKTDGKAFLEKEVFSLAGGFMPVLSDGQLSFSRQSGVLNDSHYVQILDETNIVNPGTLMHNMNQVYNQIEIKWNWNEIKQDTTRTNLLIDADSIQRHQKAPRLTRTFRGLHGSIHSTNVINKKFNALRNRYTGPPLTINPTGFSRLNNLEIGDVVRLKMDNIRDYSDNIVSLDRAFEIQGINIDWLKGNVRFSLFGSSEKANVVPIDIAASFLADSYYTAVGTNIETAFPTETSVDGGGVLHIEQNITLTGNVSLSLGVWYTDKPMELDAGVIITYTQNVFLKVLGHYQLDGVMDGSGQGLAGSAPNSFYKENPGIAGYIGSTQSAGTMSTINAWTTGPARILITQDVQGLVVEGTTTTLDKFELVNHTTSLDGLPDDLRGSSGSSGGGVLTNRGFLIPDAGIQGGTGGDGGAGLCIISRGMSHGSNGRIKSSGSDGLVSGNSVTVNQGLATLNAASGAGGAPGAVMLVMDGDAVSTPDITTMVEALQGATPIVGNPQHIGGSGLNYVVGFTQPIYSQYVGFPAQRESRREATADLFYIPADEVIEVDIPEKSQKPIAIQAVELVNTPPTVAQNLASIEISVTPPDDTTYSYTNFYAKTTLDTKYTLVGSAAKEDVMLTAMDGTSFDIRARSVSIYGLESDDFVDTQFTVSNQKGGAGMVDGNFISAGQTAFDTGIGFFLEATTTGGRASFGDSTGDKVTIENGNVFLTGSITATTGFIGGWKITATSIENSSGRIKLDNANDRIRVQNVAGTNHVTIDDAGITGFDSVLGTTFDLPTDGSAPTFSSGIINTTIFNVSTSGIIRTSSTVGDGSANSNGVLLNNTGIKVFEKNSSSPSFFADASDGTTTMGIEANDKFAKFDGTDFRVGKDSKIIGADAYSNDSIYFSQMATDVTYVTSTSGTGTVTQTIIQSVIVNSGGTAGGHAHVEYIQAMTFQNPSWAFSRRLKMRIKTAIVSTANPSYVTMGAVETWGNVGVSLELNNGNFYGIAKNAAVQTKSGVLSTYAANTEYTIEIVFTPTIDVEFFVNGSSIGTVTTNLPTGTGQALRFWTVRSVHSTGSGSLIEFQQLKFQQDD